MTSHCDGSDSERGGGIVTSGAAPPAAPEAAVSLSAAIELVREIRFDVARLRLQLDRG